MHDHQRLSSDVSETEKPQNHKELTPREVEIKKLEESSDGYIKEWKELKKEVGKMTVDFWAFQSGKLREDSKPTEEESLQLENLRNTLNTQWKEKRDLIGENKVYVCYAKLGLLFVLTFLCTFTMVLKQILAVNCTWYPLVIIMEILVSLVVLYRLLKLRRQIIAANQSDVEEGTVKHISFGNMELSYTEKLEKCVDFYSKEVMPLKEKARALFNHVSLWV
ncbi:hypothetical protein GCK72_017145 [Caenorhabditis remanei]|uniref:Uncharacterized protein n=1 Tax=Caenorhabditis remanei TaxID=31234 RepID=A0A6A5G7Q0_CAERE|nr:hypothetical protein GCK72_017145 [Caenorhabditis remanei]KAF1750594.1 hypothetical protein GCK72_017145 [Caenorhabditis remanei]